MAKNLMFEFLNLQDENNNDVKVPPLFLKINPDTFSMNSKNIITVHKTRGAIVQEHWGSELDTINCAGSTGMFIFPTEGPTVKNRWYTKSHKNFEDLNDLYKNNASTYDSNGMVINRGTVRLSFDLGLFDGYFESFTFKEIGNIPFRYEYSFVYKSEKTLISI